MYESLKYTELSEEKNAKTPLKLLKVKLLYHILIF